MPNFDNQTQPSTALPFDPNQTPDAASPVGMPPDMGAMDPNSMGASPQSPDMVGGNNMATPEQVQEIKDLMDKVSGKMQELQANHFAGSGKIDVIRQKLLKEVFRVLTMAGVDLSSRDSVNAFIDKLKATNPTLATLFENAMNVLLGDETGAGVDTGSGVLDNSSPEGVGVPSGQGVPTDQELSGNQYENPDQAPVAPPAL